MFFKGYCMFLYIIFNQNNYFIFFIKIKLSKFFKQVMQNIVNYLILLQNCNVNFNFESCLYWYKKKFENI